MKTTLRKGIFLSIAALGVSLGGPVLAQTVLYDNTVNDLQTRFNPGTYQVGNEINLASLGNLSYFSFEWYGTNTANPSSFAGTIKADVSIYYNNGPTFNGYNTPGQ
jgi:hypothetical protein